MKPSIAIYVQHYLAPSMTFIYRQIKAAQQYYNPLVLCSDTLENTDKFPVEHLFHKKRNFLRLKKSSLYQNRIFGYHRLLSTNPRLSLQQKKFFSDIIKDQKARLVHAHFGPSGIEILSTVSRAKIPLVVTFHGYDASILFNFNQYVKKIRKVFDYAHIITISEQMRNDLISIGAKRDYVSVIRCGIPVDEFQYVRRTPLSEKFRRKEKITFLQVSNFVEVKGHQYTIRAFKRFLDNYNNAKLILAGDGVTRQINQKLCDDLNISDRVEFTRLVGQDTVIRLMSEADIFLHHSVKLPNGVKEGLPTVIMEAMATGLPVIASDHSAISELITHESDGYLVEERNIEEYANRMINLSHSPADIGISARNKVVSGFNLKTETEKIFKLYNELISEKG